MLALHQKTVSATWPLLLHLPAFIPLRPLGLWPALATLAMRLWWPTRDIDTELIEQLQTWKHATVAGTTAAIFIRQRAKTKTASGTERDPHPSSSISKETWAILPAACKLWGTSTMQVSVTESCFCVCLMSKNGMTIPCCCAAKCTDSSAGSVGYPSVETWTSSFGDSTCSFSFLSALGDGTQKKLCAAQPIWLIFRFQSYQRSIIINYITFVLDNDRKNCECLTFLDVTVTVYYMLQVSQFSHGCSFGYLQVGCVGRTFSQQ